MKKLGRFAGIIFIYLMIVAAAASYQRGTETGEALAYVEAEQEFFVLAPVYQEGKSGYVMYRLADGGREELFKLFPLASFEVTDVSFWKGELVITGIERSANEVMLYRYPASEQGGQLEKETFKEFSGLPPAKAFYREGGLYVTDLEGIIYLTGGRSVKNVVFEEADTTVVQKLWKASIRNSFLLKLAVLTAVYILLCIGLLFLFKRVWKGRTLAASLSLYTLAISGALCLLVFCVVSNLAPGVWTGDKDTGQTMRMLLFGCLGIWLVLNFLLIGVLLHALRPVYRINRNLERLMAGEWALKDESFPDNELGNIGKQVSRLGKAWEVRQYAASHALGYYSRFAPAGFEGLLGKESIQELKTGDTAQVSGTMELVSIPAMQGRESVSRLNLLMEELAGRENGRMGVLLGGSWDFGRLRVLHEKSSEGSAVLAGLELMASRALSEAGVQPFVLLHTGDMVCGLAGNSENVYPFVDCRELDALERYCPQLRAMGVHMLMTEDTKKQLSTGCELRYIGYIKTEEEQRFRLYEVLEACSVEEKYKKQAMAGRFAKALQLFYQDNFYLARMHFTEVLKECPKDGVARWYLFACETLLNVSNPQEICHHLFFN